MGRTGEFCTGIVKVNNKQGKGRLGALRAVGTSCWTPPAAGVGALRALDMLEALWAVGAFGVGECWKMGLCIVLDLAAL